MRIITWCCTLLLAHASMSHAQVTVTKSDSGKTMVMVKADGGEFVPELAVVLGLEENEIRVMHALPADTRPKTSAGADIKAGDRILMVNARSVRTMQAFKKQYEAAAPGDTIKLGIKRGDNLHIVTFPKADPKDLPKGKRMFIKKHD